MPQKMRAKPLQIVVGIVSTIVIAITGFRISAQIATMRSEAAAQQLATQAVELDYEVPSTERFQPRVVIPKRFPPITQFDVKPGAEVASDLNPKELVLGVELNGEARAYPINMLTGPQREIVNDQLGGIWIAATW